MRCKCGYIFSHDVSGAHKSYALIDDKDYPAFLASEIAVHQCEEEESRQAAIARSSEYAGFVLECPRCALILMYRAKCGPLGFYKRDE